MFLKSITAILATGFLFLDLSMAQDKSYREATGLKGNVKTIKVEGGGIAEKSGKFREKCCEFLYSITFDATGKIIDTKAGIHPIDREPMNSTSKKSRYDDKGNLVEELTYEPDGSLLSKTVYTYDAGGNKVEESIYSAKGSLYRRRTFNYDAKRNFTEYVEYLGDGAPFTRRTYPKHDAKGNWLKEIVWHWESSKSKWDPYTVSYRTISYY